MRATGVKRKAGSPKGTKACLQAGNRRRAGRFLRWMKFTIARACRADKPLAEGEKRMVRRERNRAIRRLAGPATSRAQEVRREEAPVGSARERQVSKLSSGSTGGSPSRLHHRLAPFKLRARRWRRREGGLEFVLESVSNPRRTASRGLCSLTGHVASPRAQAAVRRPCLPRGATQQGCSLKKK